MALKPIQILINAKDNASQVFGSLQAKVAAVGAAILGYFSLKSFAGAVQGAAELESKLSEVQAVSGATAEEMQRLRQAAEDAGASADFTATAAESAEALANLARAGLSVDQAISALTPTLAMAQAGQIGLAESGEIVTKAMAGFGLAADQAGRITDVLVKGADSSNTSVQGLAEALSYAAPTASSLGLSIESTVAILGKFADAGIDASRAGTSLNSILSQFSDPASEFRRELAAAGITTTNFEEALAQLGAAGPRGEKALLAVGRAAGPALRGLINQGMGSLEKLREDLLGAEGAALATARALQNNLSGATQGLGSVWDTLKNKLATPVLPVLTDGVRSLTDALGRAVSSGVVTRFGEAIATTFKSGIEWAKNFAASIDAEALIARLQNFAGEAQQTFERVGQWATNAGNVVKTAYGVMSGGVNVVKTAIYGIGSVFAEVASIIMTGVAKLREGLATVTFGGLSASFREAAEDARISAGAFGASAQAMREVAVNALGDVAASAQTAREGWTGLTDAVSGGANALKGFAGRVRSVAKELEAQAEANAKARAETERLADAEREKARSTKAAEDARRALRAEYEKALSMGDVQRAAQLMVELRRTTDAAANAAQDNARKQAEAAAIIAAAFERAGIQSKDSLKRAAQLALDDFEIIKASGEATSEGIAQAWRRAAEAAIAAGDGVVPAWVSAQASMHDYTVQVDEAGRATLRLKDATGEAGGAAGDAADEYDRLGRSANGAAGEIDRFNRLGSGNGGGGVGGRAGGGSGGVGGRSSQGGDYDPGRNKYSRPGEDPRNGLGETQGEWERRNKLAGQNAVDNTTMFMLRDKLQAGLLTADDLPALQAVLAANAENDKIARAMGPGAWSLEGRADWTQWQATMALFQQQVNRLGGAGGYGVGTTDTRKRVDMRIRTDRGDYEFDTDERGEKEIQRMLIDELQRGKKRSTRR